MSIVNDFFQTIIATFKTFQVKDVIDILVVALIIFYLFTLIRRSRAGQLIKGLIILLVVYLISTLLDLTMINSILKSIFDFAVIILVVVFQPEIRQILEKMGRRRYYFGKFRSFVSPKSELSKSSLKAISDVADSCVIFSQNKIGALIVFERESHLDEVTESGTKLDSDTSVSLLSNIFYKGAPLHDGACLIKEGKITAAGCILPLTQRMDLSAHLGTRHRAAVGLSEESDAVVVIVSEETGAISLAVRGDLVRDLNREDLYTKLVELTLVEPVQSSTPFSTLFKSKKKEEEE